MKNLFKEQERRLLSLDRKEDIPFKIRLQMPVKEANLKEDDKVLDLGAHDGKILHFIDTKIDYTSVDYIKAFKDYYPNKEFPKSVISYNLEKGLPPGIKKKKFDVIFMLEFIEHIENFKTLLLQCKKILKPLGRIIITTPTNHRFLLKEDSTHYHCFRKTNFFNLAKFLDMDCKIKGVCIKVPFTDFLIPSSQIFYNDLFLVTLKNKK